MGITFARIDATKEKAISSAFNVKGFPTLLFFRDGEPREYGGARNMETVRRFCQRVSGPLLKEVTKATHEGVREVDGVSFVLLCGVGCEEGKKVMESLAYKMADIVVECMLVSDAELARDYSSNWSSGEMRADCDFSISFSFSISEK